jgi:hypothetical protein
MLVGASYLVLSATNYVGESSRTQVAIQPTAVATPRPLPTFPPEPTGQSAIAVDSPTVAPVSGPAGGAPSPTSQPSPTTAADAPIDLVVSIDSGDNPGSWLEIKTDGQTVFRKVLGQGQSVRYSAKRDLRIVAGNAAVVSITVNGSQMPRLSTTPGDVQTFTWPPR